MAANRGKNDLERVKGIEPSPPAWKAGALPLSYTRSFGATSLSPPPSKAHEKLGTGPRTPGRPLGTYRAERTTGQARWRTLAHRDSRNEHSRTTDPLFRYEPTLWLQTWWAEQDSNLRRLSRQIYSLIHLAALVSARRSWQRERWPCERWPCEPTLSARPLEASTVAPELELAMGLEPTTSSLQNRCSTS
jgi:hypothetical protein